LLSLDDPRWKDLRTRPFSGPEKFLPALKRLLSNPTAARSVVTEFAEHYYVCHQAAIEETALAVVPHFINAASQLRPADRRELLITAGWYALLIGVPALSIGGIDSPEWLVNDYHAAIREALPLTGETLAVTLSGQDPERTQLELMAALAAFHGQRTAWVLLRMAMGSATCRGCGEEFNILDEWGVPL
jgi:hypothetical protein